MTCNCRHCGNLICYPAENAGREMQCSRCGESVHLPGRLETIAGIRRIRRKSRPGIALEAGGFLSMFFFFPWGFFAGMALVYTGWRKSTHLACTQCGTHLENKDVSTCPKCRASLTYE